MNVLRIRSSATERDAGTLPPLLRGYDISLAVNLQIVPCFFHPVPHSAAIGTAFGGVADDL